MSLKKTYILTLVIILLNSSANLFLANNYFYKIEKKYTISGYIKDATTGENLPGATVYINEAGTGAAANSYGFYSISLKPGAYNMVVTFLGYVAKEVEIDISEDKTMNILLDPKSEELSEIIVSSKQKSQNIISPQMGTDKLTNREIKMVPVLMGETDLIKVLQLLPGVQASSEGSSGFSVRGGNPDQNLILLDEATVYNAGHFLGFFSVFNNDAIKSVELFKGDIPARSGGRLSSLLDIRMKDGNNKKFSGSGGLGTISSRLTLEGPIVKEKHHSLLVVDVRISIFLSLCLGKRR